MSEQPGQAQNFYLQRLIAYCQLMRLDRPIGSLLLLWPTLWALWIAGQGRPEPTIVLIFVAGVFIMRAAGCVINDYADRHYDPHVARTRNRPLASKRLTVGEALALFICLSLAALALVLLLNPFTIQLSLIGLFLAISYPFFKRFTHLPQLYLGVAFAWGIPMAFAAITESLPPVAWLLLLANVAWVLAYDTIYAMVDRKDDLRIGVRSTAILAGRYDRLMVLSGHLLCLAVLALVGWQLGLNGFYYAGLGGALAIAAYQQLLIWERREDRCFPAFLNNTWFGAVVFVGLVLAYL